MVKDKTVITHFLVGHKALCARDREAPCDQQKGLQGRGPLRQWHAEEEDVRQTQGAEFFRQDSVTGDEIAWRARHKA